MALNENVFERFARQALASPDAVALIDERSATSYSALAAHADAIARHLLELGLAPEQPVGVLMERRADLLAVLLGLWKAGAAYVPCDPQDPPDRVRRMLASCGSSMVIGDPLLLQALRSECESAGSAPPREIDPATIPNAPPGAGSLPCAAGGERLAYLLFTSGSTGEPKAVEVEHRQVLALLESACEMLKFGPGDRYLAASTIAFDASITELFLPLVTGASLLLRDRKILVDPRRFAREVREFGVSVVQTGPSVWSVVLDEVPDFPRVRVAITHGEAVTPELARRLCAYGDEVWNLYGPTETTVWATGAKLSHDLDSRHSSTSAPIGRPLPHVHAHVVDDQGRPVEDGVEGELWLGGPSVARGYRANETLTRERFVDFGGERVYRSGDLVVRDASGVLHYFGRNDDQMKVRGVRVEPREVEAAILRDPRVTQAAATWFPTPTGTRAIVAAVVLRAGAACRPEELHQGLATRLPGPMIPARFLFVPWLPITPSGKIDRKAIREAATTPGHEGAPGGAAHAPAAAPPTALTSTERAVAEIWQRLLGVALVSREDHFFSIGGDSLSAVQMLVEVEGLFGHVMPIHLAFEAPTLRSFSRRIDRIRHKADDQIKRGFVYPLVPSGSGAPLFFSAVDLLLARRGIWTVPCPLFAISNWATGSGFVTAKSLPALAAAHIQSVRHIQPKGPYRLGGFSLGGLIALEMAHQLRDAGEQIEVLFLLDPRAPGQVAMPGSGAPSRRRESLSRRVAQRLKRITQGPRELGWARWISLMLPIDLRSVVGWTRYLLVDLYLRHPNQATRLLFPRKRWRAFWFAAERLVEGYEARPYDGPALAVFCEQGPRGAVWPSLLGPAARQHTLEVPHLALFEEPARSRWMGWLSEYIRETGGTVSHEAP